MSGPVSDPRVRPAGPGVATMHNAGLATPASASAVRANARAVLGLVAEGRPTRSRPPGGSPNRWSGRSARPVVRDGLPALSRWPWRCGWSTRSASSPRSPGWTPRPAGMSRCAQRGWLLRRAARRRRLPGALSDPRPAHRRRLPSARPCRPGNAGATWSRATGTGAAAVTTPSASWAAVSVRRRAARAEDNGKQRLLGIWLPAGSVRLADNWRTIGLRGSWQHLLRGRRAGLRPVPAHLRPGSQTESRFRPVEQGRQSRATSRSPGVCSAWPSTPSTIALAAVRGRGGDGALDSATSQSPRQGTDRDRLLLRGNTRHRPAHRRCPSSARGRRWTAYRRRG